MLEHFLLNETLVIQIFVRTNFCYNKFLLQQFFVTTKVLLQQFFVTTKVLLQQIFVTTNFCYNKFLLQQIFVTTNFCFNICLLGHISVRTNFCVRIDFCNNKLEQTLNFTPESLVPIEAETEKSFGWIKKWPKSL